MDNKLILFSELTQDNKDIIRAYIFNDSKNLLNKIKNHMYQELRKEFPEEDSEKQIKAMENAARGNAIDYAGELYKLLLDKNHVFVENVLGIKMEYAINMRTIVEVLELKQEE